MDSLSAFTDRVGKEIEAEADVEIHKILTVLKSSTGIELNSLEKHWVELGRFNGVYAAIMYLNRKGWLQIPDTEIVNPDALTIPEGSTWC